MSDISSHSSDLDNPDLIDDHFKDGRWGNVMDENEPGACRFIRPPSPVPSNTSDSTVLMEIDVATVSPEPFQESFGRRILEKNGFSFAQSNPKADYARRAFDNVVMRQGNLGLGAILDLSPQEPREKINFVPAAPEVLTPEDELRLLEGALEDVHVSPEEEARLLTPDRPPLRTYNAVPPPPELFERPQPAPVTPVLVPRISFPSQVRPLPINYRSSPPCPRFHQVFRRRDTTSSRYPIPSERVARDRVEKPPSTP